MVMTMLMMANLMVVTLNGCSGPNKQDPTIAHCCHGQKCEQVIFLQFIIVSKLRHQCTFIPSLTNSLDNSSLDFVQPEKEEAAGYLIN